MKKNIVCFVLVGSLLLSSPKLLSFSVFADEQTVYIGVCGAEGDNITWTYDAETQTMTFSGTGAMDDTRRATEVPWRNGELFDIYNAKNVIFEEGITDIGYVSNYTIFGEDLDDYYLTVPESAVKWKFRSLAFMLKSVTSFAKYGSAYYYGLLDTGFFDFMKFSSTGMAEHPVIPTEGTAENGLQWRFDYGTRTLVIDGTDTIIDSPLYDHNQLEPMYLGATKIIIEKNFIVPEDLENSVYKYQYIYDLTFLNDEATYYYYQDSPFGKLYAEQQAYYEEGHRPAMSLSGYFSCLDNVVCGDINLDGKVELLDAIRLNKYTANIVQLTDAQKEIADCNADGNVDDADVTTLMEYLMFQIPSLPYQA